MTTNKFMKRGGDYWVWMGGETNVYYVDKAPLSYNVRRDWVPSNDDTAPEQCEVLSSHGTYNEAQNELRQVVKALQFGVEE